MEESVALFLLQKYFEKNQKSFKKPIDKHKSLCYNIVKQKKVRNENENH